MADTQPPVQGTIVSVAKLFEYLCAYDREKAVALGLVVACDAPLEVPPHCGGRRGWYRCRAGHGHFAAWMEGTTCWRVSSEGLAWDFLDAHLAAHASATRRADVWSSTWRQEYAAVLTARGYGAVVREETESERRDP
jgi:hypothetical protein